MSTFGELFSDRVLTALEARGAASAACAACDRDEWAVNHDTVALLNHLGDEIPQARGMSAVAIVCKNCGLVRLHSTEHLFSDLT